MEATKVMMVDHGNVFGTGHWYTFHCPECIAQVTRTSAAEKSVLCRCGCSLEWPPC